MLRILIKFNGYAVAIICFLYSLVTLVKTEAVEYLQKIECELNLESSEYCLKRMLEADVARFFRKLEVSSIDSMLLNPVNQPHWIFYAGLMVASIVLFMGLYWERKALAMPFVIVYAVVLYRKSNGDFHAIRTWEAYFTIYAETVVLLFLLLGCFSSQMRRDGRQKRQVAIAECRV